MDKLSNGMPGKTGQIASIQGGPSGERSRDLRIKRPQYHTHNAACFTGERRANDDTRTTGEPGEIAQGTNPADSGLRYIGNTAVAASLLGATRATARAEAVLGKLGAE